ncbi:hypothetical protein GLAREA_07048 [Glarea lozoyensis ATCC 20868]|uniref:Uncharacterized protein n=1 Tax=Glarea lozoyensis (strain ATCC 20868 / MF5171) TaxID=1116229 RepID=S3D8F2_GLAL2|nr:uncharacterized protein GLAREA_07048 [Glarea lozoyensis ATCC 20868]EPE34035.1 hypothetical protein GLAREA_07048 [Glarea lozoyensis ATCC 20868]
MGELSESEDEEDKTDEKEKKALNDFKDKWSKYYMEKLKEFSGGCFSDANAPKGFVEELKELIDKEIQHQKTLEFGSTE